MMEAARTLSLPPLPGPSPAPKRRKLRKGTQSCWECKRRKARCTYSPATKDVCDGCKRRGIDCISQEATDLPPPPGSNKHIVDRLGQVEALVRQLLNADQENSPDVDGGLSSRIRPEKRSWNQRETQSRSVSPAALSSNNTVTTPASSDANDAPDGHCVPSSENRYHVSSSMPSASPTGICLADDTSISSTVTHDDVSKRLLAAWPSREDMEIILAIPVETSQIIRAVICTRSSSTSTSLPSSKALLHLPPPGSHPALIGRSLLILASFLQGMPFSSAHHLEKLSTPWQDLMSRAVKTTHNLVTCNDELVASLEGIECIMLEGLYENYAGNLRPSWLAARRSVAIAQLLGLNRGVEPKSLTGSVIEPSDLWFRLIQFDRYLSLMLGMPQSSSEDIYARPEALKGCTPLDQFLRLCTVACGRLLQRDPLEVYNPVVNKEIDKSLQEASALMPAQWWVAPTLSSDDSHVEGIRETLRFNDHFMYYHLLLQLHFPNVLRPISECGYVYHRMTAVTASREILSRMMAFRATRPARYYCRGVDLIAFLSSTALCLAHICDTPQNVTAQNGFHFLAHQRLSDRGLLEQTLDIMQELVGQNNDEIAGRVATLLQHLLAIEEDVASGGRYTVAFSQEAQKDDALGYHVKVCDDGTTLRISLPHFQVIKVQREGLQRETLPVGIQAHLSNSSHSHVKSRGDELGSTSSIVTGESRSATQSVLLVPDNAEDQGFRNNEAVERPTPGQETCEANWALENLDFAFLDSFIEGTLGVDTSSGS